MRWRIRKFFRSLFRTIAYLPIVWGNEEWDWAYLFELMEFKLRRMQKAHENDKWHTNAHVYARQLLVCAELLKRIREDNYTTGMYEGFFEKYGSPLDPSRKELTPEGVKEFRRLTAYETSMKQQDIMLFCKLFSKYYAHWWI